MFSVRSLLLLVVAFLSGTQVQHFFFRPFWSTGSHSLTIAHASPAAQALLLQPAGHMGLASACSPAAARVGDIAMARRTNLKKEKRVRNRINAFRFKKGGFTKRRFFGPDAAAEQKKADEDNHFYSMVRAHRGHRAASRRGRPLRQRSRVRVCVLTCRAARACFFSCPGLHVQRGGGGSRRGGGEEEPAARRGRQVSGCSGAVTRCARRRTPRFTQYRLNRKWPHGLPGCVWGAGPVRSGLACTVKKNCFCQLRRHVCEIAGVTVASI